MPAEARLEYLDWLRGIAVLAMVQSHAMDSWTRELERHSEPYYSLQWTGGVASALFLLLAGLATAMSAGSKGRRAGNHIAGARAVRQRGWEIFLLALIFRLQAQLLGMGPVYNFFKVDMLNTMGLSIVGASYVLQWMAKPRRRVVAFGVLTAAVTFVTPIIRAADPLAVLPDPIEAYLRPAGGLAAFPLFPWGGYLFAGVLIGELIDRVRLTNRHRASLHWGLAIAGSVSIVLAWRASYLPALYPEANFWHDSPTIYFIRLGAATMLVSIAFVVHRVVATKNDPITLMGRSSLFVYWIHIEMIYGVVADPLKKALPLWQALAGAAMLFVVLYGIVLVKNWLMRGRELPHQLRIFGAILR